MAPRSRLCVAGGTAANVSITDLPETLLIRCLGLLRLRERQRAALVCKRFAAAASSPELLRVIDTPYSCRGLSKLQSLAAWLLRHGRHVRTLTFCGHGRDGEDAGAVAALTATCVTAAGAAGQLVDLNISANQLQTEWLVAVTSLQRLSLTGDSVHISSSISRLTALQSLRLAGDTHFAAGGRLPVSITRLNVEVDGEQELPEQYVRLPRLQRLRLESCSYSAGSLSRLSALGGSLTRLEVVDTESPSVAAGLSSLAQLQHLVCWLDTPEAGQAVAAALPHLTGLTCLMLWGNCRLALLPPALSSLSRLQLCELENIGDAVAGHQPAPLPVGPWLHSLRWLSTNDSILLRSLPVLQAAAALERISIKCSSACSSFDWDSAPTAAFFDWLTRHPPLRRLSLAGASDDCASMDIVEQIVRLGRSRPDLVIEFPGTGRVGESLDEYLLRTDPF